MNALRQAYFEIDRRVLGLFRLTFSVILLADLAQRAALLTFLFTNDGAVPNHYVLFRPRAPHLFSVYLAFTTRPQAAFAFLLTAVVYLLLLAGYRTKLSQVLAAVCVVSLVSRAPMLEMGATVAMSLAASWTLFLPLGDRYSLDALRRSLAKRFERWPSRLDDLAEAAPDRTPHTSIVVFGLYLQISAIYFFNFVHKLGLPWLSGRAVHWVLWQNRIATPLCAWLRVREPPWLSPLASWGTLLIEAIAPLMILIPLGWRKTRAIYFLLVCAFHAAIALLIDVGLYSYVMFAFDLLLVPGVWLDRVEALVRRRTRRRTFAYDPRDAGLHFLARVLARVAPPRSIRFEAALPAAGAPLSVRLGRALGLPPGAPEGEGAAVVLSGPEAPAVVRSRAAAGEVLGAVFAFATMAEILHDNWWLKGKVPESWRAGPPGALALIPEVLRQSQNWSMFFSPPHSDGVLVVDGLTEGGRRLDPFTGEEPDMDAVLHGPSGHGFLLSNYFSRIAGSEYADYRHHLERYLSAWQRLAHRPRRDRLVAFDVVWVECDSPPPGSTQERRLRRTVLIHHDDEAPGSGAPAPGGPASGIPSAGP